MAADGRFGGHVVQGHVDGTAVVVAPRARGPLGGRDDLAAARSWPATWCRKGSITVDGVSLTVSALDDAAGTFSVSLIPTTLELHHARTARGRRPGQPRGRRPGQVRGAAARRSSAPRTWRHRGLHERPARGAPDHRRPPHRLERDHRQRLRAGLGDPRHAPQGVGLAGRDHRQRPAVHWCSPAPPSASEHGHTLYGQAGRQVFFIITSVYGWWRWQQHKEHDPNGVAVEPRWATWRERAVVGVLWLAGVAVLTPIFRSRSAPTTRSGRTPGSSSARWSRRTRWPAAGWTSGSAGSRSTSSACRCCCAAQFYPSAVLYAVYAGFVDLGLRGLAAAGPGVRGRGRGRRAAREVPS